MNTAQKDTIYIDVDDEITSIIDKLNGSDNKIVALVLPKRAAVLQSIVNMKLLKRTADHAKKRVVLITSEAGLLPLAGAVGLHVAHNLQSKPAIPAGPDGGDVPDSVINENDIAPEEPRIDKDKSVGELSGGASKAKAKTDVDDSIELDNSELGDAAGAAAGAKAAGPKPKKDKKLKIPNFEKFRLRLILGGLGVLLLIGLMYWAFAIAPKAKITIKTDSSVVGSNVTFTTSTQTTQLDADKLIVPAKVKQAKKTDSEKVAATGQKDVGTKATGAVVLSLTDCSQSSVTIPAGTGISANGLTFITGSSVTLTSVIIGGACHNDDFKSFTSANANVSAQKAGEQYNLSPRAYTVAGFGNVAATDSTGMTGGTSKIIKVVSQADVDGAKQKLSGRVNQAATDELKKALQDDHLYALADSIIPGEPAITTTPNVGDEAADVTVTSVTNFSMTGVSQDDLKTLIKKDASKQIDTSKQSISDEGLHDATFQVQDKKTAGNLKVAMHADARIGVQPDAESIKREAAGKKKGEVASAIENRPGVKEVNVDFSPFWVSKVPKKLSKIQVVFEQTQK
jgi:hypothetical protein